jgi:hypothetical protein
VVDSGDMKSGSGVGFGSMEWNTKIHVFHGIESCKLNSIYSMENILVELEFDRLRFHTKIARSADIF